MINRIAIRLTKHLLAKNAISADDYELYHYGVFIILSELLLAVFCFAAGAVFGIPLQGLLFYVSFFSLHRFAGGFHTDTELKCQTVTLSAFLVFISAIKFCEAASIKYYIAVFFVCIAVLTIFAPADTPEKILSDEEKRKFKLLTAAVSAFFAAVIIILTVLEVSTSVICSVILGTVLETVSVLFGRLLNHKLLKA